MANFGLPWQAMVDHSHVGLWGAMVEPWLIMACCGGEVGGGGRPVLNHGRPGNHGGLGLAMGMHVAMFHGLIGCRARISTAFW